MRKVIPSATWREAIARRTRRLRAAKFLRNLIKEKGLVQGVALERVVENLIAEFPDHARQCVARPRNKGWFEGRVMALLNGRVQHLELVRVVSTKIDDFNNLSSV